MANHPNYFVREQKFWYPWDRLGHLKMTHIGNGPGHSLNYGKTAVFTFCRKAENGRDILFSPKKYPKSANGL